MNTMIQRLLWQLQYINEKYTIQAKNLESCHGLLNRWDQTLQVPQPFQVDHYNPKLKSKHKMKLQWRSRMDHPPCLARVDIAPSKLNCNGGRVLLNYNKTVVPRALKNERSNHNAKVRLCPSFYHFSMSSKTFPFLTKSDSEYICRMKWIQIIIKICLTQNNGYILKQVSIQ